MYIDIDIKIHIYIEREFPDLYQCVNTLKEQESDHDRYNSGFLEGRQTSGWRE